MAGSDGGYSCGGDSDIGDYHMQDVTGMKKPLRSGNSDKGHR